MARNARCVLPGIAYHVTQRGTNRQRVFFTGSDRDTYLGLLRENLAATQTRLLAWCLMPNHVHLALVPEVEDSLEVLLRRVHGRYAQMVNVRRLRTGHLWQSRYFSCPLSDGHLRRVLAYIERNPVRAGLVSEPEQYQWSSAAAHLGLTRDRLRLCDERVWQDGGGAEGWRALLSTPEELVMLRLLRRCTYAGRPFGEDEFINNLEQRFGRKWRRWSFEKMGTTESGGEAIETAKGEV